MPFLALALFAFFIDKDFEEPKTHDSDPVTDVEHWAKKTARKEID